MQTSNEKQEHTDSYYAATLNEKTNYPPLQGDAVADVCVIGAGFTGIATALTLVERGYSVVVVEANRVGWGASGRNGGQLINGINGLSRVQKVHGDGIADMLWDLRWRGNVIIRERVQKYGIACDLKDGFVEAALKPRELAVLEGYVEEMEKRNCPYAYALWDRETTRDKLGTEAFHGAFVSYFDGHLHPLNLCIGEARAAERQGVRIFEQSPITAIDHGVRPRARSAAGSVEADAIVIAGNAYSRLEPAHLSNLVFPAGSYIIATEPLPEDLARELNAEDAAVCNMNNIVDYFRLSADRRLLFGGACNYSGREPASIRAYIKPRMLKVYPQLEDVRIDYEWGGRIGIVLNRIPTLGRINGNVYYCQGYSGHGVNASHIMGEVLADAIGGTLETFDLFAGIRHFRIPGSQWMGNQIIALGMLYYRIKDML